ncbi:MAG TPA: trehalose-phosphatase [Ktedonobacteraceae bacterium]|jgi:trehalose 6-phosphate phosphatase
MSIAKILQARPLGLAFDIDGTLSPIAPTPGEARLYPGVATLLERARAHAQVAIMTGRALEQGAALVNVEGITYIGTHGVEWCEGLPTSHQIQINPSAQPYVALSNELLDLAEQRLADQPGIFIERKRLGGSVHYRLSPQPEQARELILLTLQEPARARNFHLSEGKKVIDIKPLLPLNKGTELRRFVQRFQLAGIVFAGDDRTDLDAVLEIARLRQDGLQAASIVVQATDTLPDLLEHADTVVQGVEGMAQLLSEMVGQLH